MIFRETQSRDASTLSSSSGRDPLTARSVIPNLPPCFKTLRASEIPRWDSGIRHREHSDITLVKDSDSKGRFSPSAFANPRFRVSNAIEAFLASLLERSIPRALHL